MLATDDEKAPLGFLMERLVTKGYINSQKKQHLYILSDDEIKEGDWFIYGNNESGYHLDTKAPDTSQRFGVNTNRSINNPKKVIASTDLSLLKPGAGAFNSKACLPQPSEQFLTQYVKAYNNAKPIEEVEVEYELCETYRMDECNSRFHCCENPMKLKISSNNTINIKLVKDTWTKEEVINLLYKTKASLFTPEEMDKWIEENL